MQTKYVVLGALLIGFFSGVILAATTITGASISGGPLQSRWAGTSSSSVATQGGNITYLNISDSQLTVKWTAFYGNVSGTIVLGNGTNNIYTWTANTSNGGEVCISTNGAQAFSTPANGSTSDIDTNFSTGGGADNASATFTQFCPAMNVSGNVLTGYIAAKPAPAYDTFYTCASKWNGGSSESNYAFCTNVNSTGLNYLNNAMNFEIIAPASGAVTTYYFYLEMK